MQLSIYNRKILSKYLDEIDEDLQQIIIEKDEKLRNKLLKQLKEALLTSFDDQRREAINKAIDYLLSVDKEKFTKSDAKNIDSILKQTLGEDLNTVLEKNVNDLVEKLFKSGINDVGRSLKLKLSFDVVDSRAASILGEHTMFWILNYYSDQLQTEIDDILKGYYTEGKLIGEVASDFAEKFTDKSNRGFAYFEGLAEHTTYRVSELGKINGFEKAGIEFYEIKAIIDDRTSDICRQMDGVIFPVSEAIKFRDEILKLKSPEEIKNFAPWRPAREILDYKKNGFPTGMALPPYHWRCRTIVIAYFGDQPIAEEPKVTEDVEISIGKLKLSVKDYEKKFLESKHVKLGNNIKGRAYGNFRWDQNGFQINVKQRAPEKLATFLHETGHAIDHLFLDQTSKSDFLKIFRDTNISSQILGIIKHRLVRYEPVYEKFSDLDLKNLLSRQDVVIDGKTYRMSAKHIRYLLSREEIIAEAYSQYRVDEDFNKYAIDFFNYFSKITNDLITNYGK